MSTEETQDLGGGPTATVVADGSGRLLTHDGQPPIFLRCNENVIRAYPTKVLGLFYWIKARVPNSVVFGGFSDRQAAVFGWSRRTHFAKISALIASGLATKDQFGNVRLIAFGELIARHNDGQQVKHRCSVKVEASMSPRDVADQLSLKLLEQKHRQIAHAVNERETREKNEGKGEVKTRQRKTKLFQDIVTKKDMVDFRNKGFEAIPGSTMRTAMDMNPSQLAGWKKRMKARDAFRQVNRRKVIPTYMITNALLKNTEVFKEVTGASLFRSKLGLVMVQPSLIRLTEQYRRPIVPVKIPLNP